MNVSRLLLAAGIAVALLGAGCAPVQPWVKPYERERLAMTEALLPYDLGAVLVAALERSLSEPLDGVDEPEYWKQRVRQTY